MHLEDGQQSGDAEWSHLKMKKWGDNKPGRVWLLTGITMPEPAKFALRKSLKRFMKDLNILHLCTISLNKPGASSAWLPRNFAKKSLIAIAGEAALKAELLLC